MSWRRRGGAELRDAWHFLWLMFSFSCPHLALAEEVLRAAAIVRGKVDVNLCTKPGRGKRGKRGKRSAHENGSKA